MLVKTVAVVLAVVSIYSFLSGIIIKIKRMAIKENGVYSLNMTFVIGSLLSLVFSALACYVVFYTDVPLYAAFFFFIFILVGLKDIIIWKNRYILYDDGGFIYKRPFRFKRHCTYNQITGFCGMYGTNMCILVGKKKVRIDENSKGVEDFLDFAMTKSPNLYKQKSIYYSDDEDLVSRFKYLSVHVIGIIVFCTICVSLAFVCVNWDSNFEFEQQIVKFTAFEYISSNMQLTCENDDNTYTINNYKENLKDETEKIEALIESGEKFVIWVHNDPQPTGIYFLDIHHFQCGDIVFFTFDDAKKHETRIFVILFLICFVGLIVNIVHLIVGIIVAKNPKKHKRLYRKLYERERFEEIYTDYD